MFIELLLLFDMYVELKGKEGPYEGKRKKVLLKAPNYTVELGRTVSNGKLFYSSK